VGTHGRKRTPGADVTWLSEFYRGFWATLSMRNRGAETGVGRRDEDPLFCRKNLTPRPGEVATVFRRQPRATTVANARDLACRVAIGKPDW
jgi:hypothetical protein